MRATPSSLNILTLFYKDDGYAIINTIKNPFFSTKIPTPNTYISPPIERPNCLGHSSIPTFHTHSTLLYPLLGTEEAQQYRKIPSHCLSLISLPYVSIYFFCTPLFSLLLYPFYPLSLPLCYARTLGTFLSALWRRDCLLYGYGIVRMWVAIPGTLRLASCLVSYL